MRTYGITVSDILAAIDENRNAVSYWTKKNGEEFRVSVPNGKREAIVKSHTDNIRDLRITLAAVRFDNDDIMRFVSAEFVPFIITDAIPADDSETLSESDRNAFADAIEDTISEAEMVTA